MLLDGALLVNKSPGVTSFGVVEQLQRILMERSGLKRKNVPKFGHGGTLDPFATGLLIVLVGRAVKLARYFLGSRKTYEGVFRFGETTVPGDPTAEISERTDSIPASIEAIRKAAEPLVQQPYLQTPPMHSAKKHKGKPLYELARQGIEIDREPKVCHLYEFEIRSYSPPEAEFRLLCSSGTYVRTLAQDLAKLAGSLGLLSVLHRTGSGPFRVADAMTVDEIAQASLEAGPDGMPLWNELKCWLPFDRLLEGFDRAEATADEVQALIQGRQNALFSILRRAEAHPVKAHDESCLAIYSANRLVAVARQGKAGVWELERVFPPSPSHD